MSFAYLCLQVLICISKVGVNIAKGQKTRKAPCTQSKVLGQGALKERNGKVNRTKFKMLTLWMKEVQGRQGSERDRGSTEMGCVRQLPRTTISQQNNGKFKKQLFTVFMFAVPCVLLSKRSRGEHQVPWIWIIEVVSCLINVLGTKMGPQTEQHRYALNHRAISPASCLKSPRKVPKQQQKKLKSCS